LDPQIISSQKCSEAVAVRTFADVLTLLDQHPDLRADRRRNMISSVRNLCRVFDAEPSIVMATPSELRHRLEAVPWQVTGYSRAYISNLKTHALAALETAGVPILHSRVSRPLSPDWSALKDKIGDLAIWCHLTHFAAFCVERTIRPSGVDESVFAQFESALQERSIKPDPTGRTRALKWAWNQAATKIDGATAVPLPVPKPSRRYTLPWDAFQASFHADVQAFQAAKANPNPFAKDYYKPVAASTAALRSKQIAQIASALVASGFPLTSLTSLAVLVDETNAEAALTYLFERAGSKKTVAIHQQADLLWKIAKYYVKAPDATILRLKEMAAGARIKKTGVVAKNRAVLRQFDEDANLVRMLALPPKVFGALAGKAEFTGQDVARGVYAMAVEIELHVPLRVGNLCDLELDSQIQIKRSGTSDVAHILVPTTKNEDAYETVLTGEAVRWLQFYLKHIRPMITSLESSALFPNEHGELRHKIAFSRGIMQFVEREIGLQMTTHNFRHLAVKLQQRFNSGDTETAPAWPP
jgi:hypothetical protein